MLGLFSIHWHSHFYWLPGLVRTGSYMANRKVKEIGIRKVLGATVSQIVLLFSKEFLQLIVIGFVVATPVSWYLMTKWLLILPTKLI